MNDLISEYQQYQEATVDDDEFEGDGDDLEQDEAQCDTRLCILVHIYHIAAGINTWDGQVVLNCDDNVSRLFIAKYNIIKLAPLN